MGKMNHSKMCSEPINAHVQPLSLEFVCGSFIQAHHHIVVQKADL